MTEPDQPGLPPSEPPRIELDPHPEPPRAYTPFRAPEAAQLEPADGWEGATNPSLVPWEDEAAIPGALDRWWATVKLGFTDPLGLADRVPGTDPILPAWLFHLLMGLPATVLNLALGEMTQRMLASFFHAPVRGNPIIQTGASLGGVLVIPFLGGAILHLFLWMWGGVKEGAGMNQTIRFFCYAYGVFYLVSWIPLLNVPLGIVFWVFFSMGLARTHRTDLWRGFAATLTPFLLCCCLGIGVAVLLVGRL